MAQCKEKTRYNIRLAGRKGVTVQVEDTDDGFETFAKLYFDTTKRQHYFGHNKEYHKIVWETMKNGLAHILISRFQNEPLGAYELFYFKNTLFYPYGGSSDLHRNVMAPNLLMWEAIRLGKQLGATSFDMWGSTTPNYDEKDPFYGFTRFKEGYNAKFVEMIGSYDLIVNSSLYKAYSAVHYLRKLYLSIRA
jgi:lipid II:glycine glycyltransferase (peptidoglycan interpeptide bridge formation enzyme)